LPAYFASEKIDQIQEANPRIDDLRTHRNAREVHRELRQTPQRAWDQALKEGRSVIRPAPRCAWWDYVWSVRTALKIGPDGRVPIGTQRLRIERPPPPRSCSACIPRATTPYWPPRPTPKKNQPSCSPTAQTETLSCFANYKTFLF
jgi:hypothetical protein